LTAPTAATGCAAAATRRQFLEPVYLTAPPADTQRLFVIQQDGAC